MVELPVSPQELNLSYQDLGDPFQWESFLRILRRLIRVENLQLVSDSLSDLSSVRLPRLKPHYPECTTATVRETQSQSTTSLLVSFFISSLLLNSLQRSHTHTQRYRPDQGCLGNCLLLSGPITAGVLPTWPVLIQL